MVIASLLGGLVLFRPSLAEFVIECEYHGVKLFAIIPITVGGQVIVQRAYRDRSGRTIHADILTTSTDDVVGAKKVSRNAVSLWRLRDIYP